MSNIRLGFVLAATLVALLFRPSPVNAQTQPDVTSPVKVFILAGQSNMVGDGRVGPVETKGTLAYMVQESDKRDQFKHLVDNDGN